MTDIGLILHKLQRIRQQISLIRARRPAEASTLDEDLILRDALALAILVTAQEIVDIAYHICADEMWGVPQSHAEAFSELVTHGVLEPEVGQAVTGVARLRNRIAHGYASVDHAQIWRELPDGISALEAFVRQVAAWLPDPS